MHKSVLLALLLLLSFSSVGFNDGSYKVGQIGIPGAIQTPTSFFPDEGNLSVGFSNASPYNTLYLNFQPVSWLNFNTRYTDITDRPYPGSVSGQSYKDKSFDFSIRLFKGGEIIPAISFGLVDIGGTGFFASEYLSASKQIYDVSFSVGLGWGRLGSRGDIKNPARFLSDKFRVRPGGNLTSQAGGLSNKRWFRGEEVALFGSLIWSPEWLRDFSALVELDGNAYNNEAAVEAIQPKSRFNYGASYRFSRGSEFSLSYLRGDTISGQISTSLLIGKDHPSKKNSNLPELYKNRHAVYRREVSPDLASALGSLYKRLANQGFYVHAMDIDSDLKSFQIWQSNNKTDHSVLPLQFIGREVINFLPESVEFITIITMSGGMEASRVDTTRSLIDDQASAKLSETELVAKSKFQSGKNHAQAEAKFPNLLNYPTYAAGVNPALRSNIGGPTRFYAGQLLLKPFATLQLTQRLSLTGTAAVNVVNNIKNLQDFNSGSLPRVRSDIEVYQSNAGAAYLDELELNYFYPISKDLFGRFSAGIFEEMFGGAAVEFLYRPYTSRWALSLDANYVVQRDFNQLFSFRDYKVATGHVTLYYKAPIKGINVKLSAGRYLAKDLGATLDISREFRNGTRFGVFATKTNVSAAEFGEGSFDKGFYINIPLSEFSLGLKGATSVRYSYLSRDGGQKVDDGVDLFSVVGKYRLDQVYDR